MPTFRGKRFTDDSLLGLARVETIKGIALYNTAVTDDGFVAFAERAKKLTTFHASSSNLTDKGLGAILAHCPIANLQIHDAIGVTDSCAKAIAEHSDITELYLNGTNIGDVAAKHLSKMPNVWSFCANGTRIGDRGLGCLGAMPKLTLLSLNRTRVRGSGLRELAEIDNLNVYLEDCRISDDGIGESLPHMSRLRRFSLSQTDVTDRGLEAIGTCRQLEDLRLDDTGITDVTIELLEDLPSLEVLYVRRTGASQKLLERLARKRDLTIYSDFDD
jgi:hypothetical protein